MAVPQGFNEIGRLVNESVLIADLETGYPPVAHIRMIAIGDVDALPAAKVTLIGVVEIFEAMEIMEVPFDRCFLAVDLKCVERLMAAGVASGFEGREGAVFEPRHGALAAR